MFFNKSKKMLAAANEQLMAVQQELDATMSTVAQLKGQVRQVEESLENKHAELVSCRALTDSLLSKYADLVDKDQYLKDRETEILAAQERLQELNGKYTAARAVYEQLEGQISLYQESLEIGSFGLYQPQFDFETPELFKQQIAKNYEAQKQLVKEDRAVVCRTQWTVNGSVVIYSENAPQLEYELHQRFAAHRSNRISNKKEFFKVTLADVEEFVNQHTNAAIRFTQLAEAREHRETLTVIEQLKAATETTKKVPSFPASVV